jgi:hypothetical protein
LLGKNLPLGKVLHAELDCRTPEDPAAFRELAERWLTEACAELAGDLMEVHAGTGSLPGGFSLEASLSVTRMTTRGRVVNAVRWTKANWTRFLKHLDAVPLEAEIRLELVTPEGFHEGAGIGVTVNRPFEAQEWTTLAVDCFLQSYYRKELEFQHSALDFLKRQSALVDPVYGYIADDVNPSSGRTSLETTLGLLDFDTLPRSAEQLRGYSWITVCSPGVAEILGGVKVLRESGAFHAVEPTQSGAVILQATPDIRDYTGERVDVVFRTLAPALPRGLPFSDHYEGQSHRLVYQDAAEVS